LALGLFNLGVELGQLAVLALALPLILILHRRPGFKEQGVRALSAGVIAIGLMWFFERVWG
jgi:hypothetical protein